MYSYLAEERESVAGCEQTDAWTWMQKYNQDFFCGMQRVIFTAVQEVGDDIKQESTR